MPRSTNSRIKRPAKTEVVCPHCGSKQKESIFARSTICSNCGQHFEISQSATPVVASKPKFIVRDNDDHHSKHSGLFGALTEAFGGWLSVKRGPRVVQCYECGARSEASRAAQSTACPKCGAYIDLQDVLVDRSVSRVIRTQGNLRISAKGSLTSTRAYVGNALVEGNVDGTLIARDNILVHYCGLIRGNFHAREIEIAKKSRIKFLQSVHADRIIVRGEVEGELHATGSVIVHKNGKLMGKVFARGFQVDKGGEFHGNLQIGGMVPPDRPDDLFELAEQNADAKTTGASLIKSPAH